MVTVSEDATVVETDLTAGRLACPGCGDRLARWGWARSRPIREGLSGRTRLHRPRRARCGGCGATRVLLAVVLAARRADTAEVIAAAIEAKVARGIGRSRRGWADRRARSAAGCVRSPGQRC